MKKLILLVFTLPFFTNPLPNYQQIFGSDYDDALVYFKKNSSTLKKYANYYSFDNEIISPAVFPERIRYSLIRDLIETKAVEMVYIDYGSDYVDFSIGDFQIKPSFAEKIEEIIVKDKVLKTKFDILIKYKSANPKLVRATRVKRLKALNFQMIYIAAFYDIVNNRYDFSKLTKEKKIAYFAVAYNHGFDVSYTTLEKRTKDKFFPYGTRYKGIQYSYTNIAIDFYMNHYYKIFD